MSQGGNGPLDGAQRVNPIDVCTILYRFVDLEQPQAGIVAQGFDPAMVERVARPVFRSEYKRRQAAPGPKVSRRAFGWSGVIRLRRGEVQRIVGPT